MPPSANGSNGDRDHRGRYLRGHGLPGPGNPLASRVHQYRAAFARAVTDEDLEAIARMLVRLALENEDLAAVTLILKYCLGSADERREVTMTADDDGIIRIIKHYDDDDPPA